MRPSFFHHLHPPTIPAAQARFRYTLGAGGLAVFLVVALVVTGILLMFFYVPTPERAAQSIQAVTYLRSEERRVGKECRSRWSPYH